MQIITNKTDYEHYKHFKLIKSDSKKKEMFIAYKLNGYWFYLSMKMWSEFCGIGYNTLYWRVKNGKTPAQILGFELIKNPKLKNGGNSYGKNYMRGKKDGK